MGCGASWGLRWRNPLTASSIRAVCEARLEPPRANLPDETARKFQKIPQKIKEPRERWPFCQERRLVAPDPGTTPAHRPRGRYREDHPARMDSRSLQPTTAGRTFDACDDRYDG